MLWMGMGEFAGVDWDGWNGWNNNYGMDGIGRMGLLTTIGLIIILVH